MCTPNICHAIDEAVPILYHHAASILYMIKVMVIMNINMYIDENSSSPTENMLDCAYLLEDDACCKCTCRYNS